jgi:protease-4
MYRPQMNEFLKAKVGIDKDDDLIFASINEVASIKQAPNKAKDEIAIVYAEGGIDMGETNGVNTAKLVEDLTKIQNDKNVKAVVLRVNSLGGSAYGSEQIWRALTKLKAKKPLIVSMGDYAASGGYYISCMADVILAQPNTITGSIGIFGLIPNIAGLNNKIGLTYDGVKTNKLSDAISINRPFRPEERDLMQNYVNRGYELFVKRCADGRKMSIDQIKAIAEGRVWTGEDALKIGLVDKIGGIDEAIQIAVDKAKLTAYNVKEYPVKEDFATKLMKSFGEDMETRFIKAQLGEQYKLFREIKNIEKINGIQARLPYELIIK